jgi:hypothetical protein
MKRSQSVSIAVLLAVLLADFLTGVHKKTAPPNKSSDRSAGGLFLNPDFIGSWM